MTQKSDARWMELMSLRVAVANPTLFSAFVGLLGSIAFGGGFDGGVRIAFWSAVVLKLHWMYQVNQYRDQGRAPSRALTAFGNLAGMMIQDIEQESLPVTTGGLPATWIRKGDRQVRVDLPGWMTIEHLMAIDLIMQGHIDPTETTLCGRAGPFTGKPTGTLALLREWCFEQQYGAPKKVGEWADIYRAGWRFTSKGRQDLHSVRWQPDMLLRVPSPTPEWYRNLQRKVNGSKQVYFKGGSSNGSINQVSVPTHR